MAKQAGENGLGITSILLAVVGAALSIGIAYGALGGEIAANAVGVASNDAGVAANAERATANTAGVAANVVGVASNAERIDKVKHPVTAKTFETVRKAVDDLRHVVDINNRTMISERKHQGERLDRILKLLEGRHSSQERTPDPHEQEHSSATQANTAPPTTDDG